MSVFEDVVRELDTARKQDPDAQRFTAEVDHGDVKVRVEAGDFDRLGIRIHELSVEGEAPAGPLEDVLRSQVDALAGADSPTLGALAPQEIDGRLGAGILRTRPDDMHRGYFFEATLEGGRKASVRRQRRDPDTHERQATTFTTDDEAFGEVVDTLKGALHPAPVPAHAPSPELR